MADDNADVVACLAMLLEMKGWAVIKAYDGPQAVAAAEREQPDVVLLDIGMPGLDGHAACRRIRALPAGRRLRIIALSGWGLDSDCRRSTEAGFDGHLVKPVTSADLLRVLHGA
ncbi:response regulator [uncultured Thiohalocapsa sp.]|uniref:response regulator n=1 Tax=uncultured Thiohalocapsa sp. TaxID=768990 RepID=UPI0025F793ED|nr:response regulator [uncultured Thiohalocapsa sp.]